MNDDTDDEEDRESDAEIEAIHARITERVLRCLRMQLVAIGRDYERCGKAACARSRRCRGFACEPQVASDDDDALRPSPD